MTTESCFVIPDASSAEPTAPPESPSALPDRRTLAAFGLFVLLGGGSSVAIRITYGELPPFWAAASRFGLAALVFWLLILIRKLPIPRGRALLGAALFGTLSIGLAFPLIAWGLVETPASIYQVLMALGPLLTIFLAFFQGLERIRWQGLLGALLAVAGIAVVVSGSGGKGLSLPHILAIIGAAACISEAGVVAKKFPRCHPIATNAIGMTIGAFMLGAISLISREQWIIPTQLDTWIAFMYVFIFVTIIAFLLYLFILGRWTASGTSYGFVLIPLVTAVVASTLVGEQVTYGYIIGAALVISGAIVGALLPSRSKRGSEGTLKSVGASD